MGQKANREKEKKEAKEVNEAKEGSKKTSEARTGVHSTRHHFQRKYQSDYPSLGQGP